MLRAFGGLRPVDLCVRWTGSVFLAGSAELSFRFVDVAGAARDTVPKNAPRPQEPIPIVFPNPSTPKRIRGKQAAEGGSAAIGSGKAQKRKKGRLSSLQETFLSR